MSSSSSSSSLPMDKNPNPTTPPYQDPLAYAEAYLVIHTMSPPSYRYVYLLWFSIVLVFIVFALLHWTGSRGGALGALWSKWTLRRRTWRKKQALEAARRNPAAHRQPFSFPSNAQILSFFALTLFTLCACFLGPDYIAPSAKLWQFQARPNAVANLPPVSPPSYTIHKAWWTVGGRTGIVAFSLFPLVILFAIKTPPFAFLSLPFLLQLHFDKLSHIHRWSGILVWLITTLHVITWGVQLARDTRVGVDHQSIWMFVWLYDKFVYGCIAYFCLSLLVLMSLPILRNAYYEAFYALHIFLVPLSIAMAGLHFPRLSWWCWSALGIWLGERLWRLIRFCWINGIGYHSSSPSHVPMEVAERTWDLEPQESHWSPNHASTYSEQFDVSMYAEPASGLLTDPTPSPTATSPADATIPPGFAWAYLLPGRTIRLRVHTWRPVRWSPGQHVLLRVPSVSQFTTHPFTIASVCQQPSRQSLSSTQPVELLIRAKAGFTRELWNEVHRLSTLPRTGTSFQPSVGAFIRAEIDGPFGSVSRTRWGNFSSVLIVAGGSGVSFGIAVLEFLCLCISGQNASALGSNPGGLGYSVFRTRRIRFVWLVREYSHLQWCAAAIWRCTKLLPSEVLEVDIYVTNISRSVRQRHHPFPSVDPTLGPPTPSYARDSAKRHSWASLSVDSDDEHAPSMSPAKVSYTADDPSFHPLDLTNFNGDDDSFMPGEAQLSYRVHREGHLRRRETQRRSTLLMATAGRLDNRLGSVPPTPLSGREDNPLIRDRTFAQDGNLYQLHPPLRRQDHSDKPRQFTVRSGLRVGHSVRLRASPLVIETEDARALFAISEIAQSGKPPLETILAEEVVRSRGPIGVACCGPTSLNALMRKLVAAQIDPGRIRRGDLRGSITFVSEDFDY